MSVRKKLSEDKNIKWLGNKTLRDKFLSMLKPEEIKLPIDVEFDENEEPSELVVA